MSKSILLDEEELARVCFEGFPECEGGSWESLAGWEKDLFLAEARVILAIIAPRFQELGRERDKWRELTERRIAELEAKVRELVKVSRGLASIGVSVSPNWKHWLDRLESALDAVPKELGGRN